MTNASTALNSYFAATLWFLKVCTQGLESDSLYYSIKMAQQLALGIKWIAKLMFKISWDLGKIIIRHLALSAYNFFF